MKKTIIEVLKELKPREAVNGKEYPEFKKGLEAVLNVCYSVYQAREKGTATKEAESKAMTEVTAFLHTLGKVNGKYISVCEKTTENGIASVLFDTLVYHSFRDRIYTKSITLAEWEAKKKTAGQEKAKAHEALVNGKGSTKAYKEAIAKFEDICDKINAERDKANAEGTLTEKESLAKFTKFTTARLKAIIENRYAISPEEAEAMRKLRNKAKADKKKEAKPQEAKKPTKAKATKPEAVSPEAVKKTA